MTSRPCEEAGFVAVQRRRRAVRAHHPRSDATVTDPPSAAQTRLMFLLFHEHGITGREERLAATAQIVGHRVPTSILLSRREVGMIIDHLTEILDDGLF
jgi:hypothetical protein